MKHRCLDVWDLPHELSLLKSGAARDAAVDSHIKTSEDGAFPPNSLAMQSPITCGQELATVVSMFIVIGGPLLLMLSMPCTALLFGWRGLVAHVAIGVLLGWHPLSRSHETGASIARSSLVQAWYKYFSFRVVWCDDYRSDAVRGAPFIGVGAPHGVMPLANMLSVPAANSFMGLEGSMPFIGSVAPIFYNTPFLRYLSALGTIDCSRKSIEKSLAKGHSVGLVADGIAGIFRSSHVKETLVLKSRKGIAKMALRTGTTIMPCYSIGNTAAFTAFFDSCGVMETLSRKVKIAFFLFWGRCGLPVPHRVNITMIIGKPILVKKVQRESGEPTQVEIDALHATLLRETRAAFDAHKDALGWGHKEMIFE